MSISLTPRLTEPTTTPHSRQPHLSPPHSPLHTNHLPLLLLLHEIRLAPAACPGVVGDEDGSSDVVCRDENGTSESAMLPLLLLLLLTFDFPAPACPELFEGSEVEGRVWSFDSLPNAL